MNYQQAHPCPLLDWHGTTAAQRWRMACDSALLSTSGAQKPSTGNKSAINVVGDGGNFSNPPDETAGTE
jgi:hypothetical protein